MIFVGVDWAEDHHDVCVMAEDGRVLGKRRVADSVLGIGKLHGLVAEHAGEDETVVVGVEIDRGLLVGALLAAGYEVFAINPMAVARYRERHAVSGAKSDPGDAKLLADLVRTDRHNHRPVPGDSELIEAVKLLARAHQSAIWSRQRQLNALRSALREYYPGALAAFGTDLSNSDALAVLEIAPTPELGRGLSRSKLAAALRLGGRVRNIERRAEEIQAALRGEYLEAPPTITNAYGTLSASALKVIASFSEQIAALEEALSKHFEKHTRRSSAPCQDWGRSLAPGCSGSSVMTGLAFPGPSLARTSPVRHRSRKHPVAAASSWPAMRGTAGSATPATDGPFVRSRLLRAPAITTTSSVAEARPTDRRSVSSPTVSSASSTPASRLANSTTSKSPGCRTRTTAPLDSYEPWGV